MLVKERHTVHRLTMCNVQLDVRAVFEKAKKGGSESFGKMHPAVRVKPSLICKWPAIGVHGWFSDRIRKGTVAILTLHSKTSVRLDSKMIRHKVCLMSTGVGP